MALIALLHKRFEDCLLYIGGYGWIVLCEGDGGFVDVLIHQSNRIGGNKRGMAGE
jgi:hypothetical protein